MCVSVPALSNNWGCTVGSEVCSQCWQSQMEEQEVRGDEKDKVMNYGEADVIDEGD